MHDAARSSYSAEVLLLVLEIRHKGSPLCKKRDWRDLSAETTRGHLLRVRTEEARLWGSHCHSPNSPSV